MDWLKQSQEMMKNWMETQQKMVNSFTDMAKDAVPAPAASMWEKTVQTWEHTFKNMLETQALWARMWARSLVQNSPAENTEQFVKSIETMTQTWVDTQKQLWENWFTMVKQFDPSKLDQSVQEQATKATQDWQEAMQKIMETQADWARQWAEMTTPKKKDDES